MTFGRGGSAPAPAPVVAPDPPPNPPMFGQNAQKGKAGGQQTPSFSASVLGALPTSTANKTLLGQ